MSTVQGARRRKATTRAKKVRVVRSIPGAATAAPAGSNGHAVAPPFKMPHIAVPTFPPRVVDIRDHGAVAGGRIDCTQAIADAIAACAKAGGGRVLIPAGEWLSGAIHLASNIDLHLDRRAVVRFSTDSGMYLPPVLVRWGGQECFNYSPFIYARNCENIAITGRGTLMGQGKTWWPWHDKQNQIRAKLAQMVVQGVPVADRRFGCLDMPLRPQFISPINCRNILLEDFTIGEAGPCWTIHLTFCEGVTVRRLHVKAPDGPNTDGVVIDSCRNVLVEDCDLHTGGDCIALKSGLSETGRRVGKPTENVIIRRTRTTAGTSGISIGSEMSGGVRNVFAHDCTCDGPRAGIRVKASRGRGGIVENVHLHDITMDCIHGDAIEVTTEYPAFAAANGKPPTLRNIHLRNIVCKQAKTAARIIGLADSTVRGLTLTDVTIAADAGLHCTSANGLQLINVRIAPQSGAALSLRDSQDVLIQGVHHGGNGNVFLDLRGHQTRQIKLRGEPNDHVRPTIVLGLDVPKDALLHE